MKVGCVSSEREGWKGEKKKKSFILERKKIFNEMDKMK
jgi:hypothetical protein